MTDFEQAVLHAVYLRCSQGAGFTTGQIADFVGRQPGRDSDRKHSAAVLQALCALETVHHRVRRLEDGMPIVWCRTA